MSKIKSEKKYDVLCIGVTCVDMIFAHMQSLPELGKEAYSEDFLIKVGGAANNASCLTKLGLKTVFCTSFGDDNLGKIVYDFLKEDGIATEGFIIKTGGKTSVTAVLSFGHDRSFASYYSKINTKKMNDQIRKFAKESRHIHCFITDCFMFDIIDIAKENGCTLSVDSSWDPSISFEKVVDVLKSCDIFMANEDEALEMTKKSTVEEAIAVLSSYNKHVVVKMSSKGSMALIDGKKYFIPAVEGITAIDPTGAGDAHASGYLYGYLYGMTADECLGFANASGAVVVGFYGGIDQSYTKEKVEMYNREP